MAPSARLSAETAKMTSPCARITWSLCLGNTLKCVKIIDLLGNYRLFVPLLCSWVSQRYKGNFDFVRPIQITTAVFQFRQQLKTSCFFLRTSKDRGFLKMLVYVSFLTLDDRTIQTCPKSLCEFRRSSSRSSKSCSRLPSVYGSLCLSQKSGNHILI